VTPEGAVFVTGGSGFIGGRLIRRLVSEGSRVRALARSDGAADKVAAAGAEPARGDLENPAALRAGAEGCDLAFHAAAAVLEWGPREAFVRANVDGTKRVLEACREAGVQRLVHVGTEAANLAGQPLVNIDETAPLRPDSKADYSATKALAEEAVRAAGGDAFETVVVRPRLVWGPGDTTILPGVVAAAPVASAGSAAGAISRPQPMLTTSSRACWPAHAAAAPVRPTSSPTASRWSSATSSPSWWPPRA
jgi:nucleoside-diphosphate-sugar epimerase